MHYNLPRFLGIARLTKSNKFAAGLWYSTAGNEHYLHGGVSFVGTVD